MKLLIIDTCGAIGSVALADSDGSVVAGATLPGRSASERLVTTIRELTAGPWGGLKVLGAVAVVNGPGSFTGVRVGLSAAKGLCEALDVPLIAVSRLAVMAEMAEARQVVALLDAGRGEFYLGEYMDEKCVREALVSLEQVRELVTSETMVVACEDTVAQAAAALDPRMVPEPTAEDALAIILRRLRAENFDDVATVDANYLRRTDAEIFAKPAVAIQR